MHGIDECDGTKEENKGKKDFNKTSTNGDPIELICAPRFINNLQTIKYTRKQMSFR